MTPEPNDHAELIDSDLTMFVHAVTDRQAICTTDDGRVLTPKGLTDGNNHIV